MNHLQNNLSKFKDIVKKKKKLYLKFMNEHG